MRASSHGPTRSAPSAHFHKPEEACAGDMPKKKKNKNKNKKKGKKKIQNKWSSELT
jgi:hypothetical protein